MKPPRLDLTRSCAKKISTASSFFLTHRSKTKAQKPGCCCVLPALSRSCAYTLKPRRRTWCRKLLKKLWPLWIVRCRPRRAEDRHTQEKRHTNGQGLFVHGTQTMGDHRRLKSRWKAQRGKPYTYLRCCLKRAGKYCNPSALFVTQFRRWQNRNNQAELRACWPGSFSSLRLRSAARWPGPGCSSPSWRSSPCLTRRCQRGCR